MPNQAPEELWPGWDDLGYQKGEYAISPVVLDKIWTAQWHEISSLELIPGVALQEDVWVVPRAWVVGETERTGPTRTIDFNVAIPVGADRSDEWVEGALRRLKRLAVIMLTQVGWIGRTSTTLPKPATWVKCVRAVCRMAKIALEAEGVNRTRGTCPDGVSIFADLSPRVFDEMRRDSSSLNYFVGQVNALFRSGHFDDWPTANVAGVPVDSTEYLPFADDGIVHLAKAALWFQEIGPDLIDCWFGLLHETRTPSGLLRENYVHRHREQWLADWQGANLKRGKPFPFAIKVRSSDGKNTTEVLTCWPPKKPTGVRSMITTLQAANMIVLLLVTGARDGEVAGLLRDCLADIGGIDVLEGKIFKTSVHPEGTPHAWPLPPQAVRAVELQQRLGATLWSHRRSLWVPFYNQENAGIGTTHSYVRRFCERVFLPDGRAIAEAIEGPVHPHRFRKTVARYAALALVGANQVLQDVLGHRDPSITFNYMLADPELQEDMRIIAHEATIALATQVLTDEGLTGAAAAGVAHLRERLTARDASAEMGLDDLRRAAEILSQHGSLMLVRPNVLCTKTVLQAGPCNKRLGSPDIGNCRSGCGHRLELDAAKADHRAAMGQALREGREASGFMRLWWIDQVAHHRAALLETGSVVPNEAEVCAFLAERTALVDEVL